MQDDPFVIRLLILLKRFLHKYLRKVDLAIGQTHFKRKIHRRQVITQYTNIGQGRAFKS